MNKGRYKCECRNSASRYGRADLSGHDARSFMDGTIANKMRFLESISGEDE